MADDQLGPPSKAARGPPAARLGVTRGSVTSKSSVTLRDASSYSEHVARYYNSEDLSDVILQVGDKEYPAHKFILGKSSEVRKSFDTLFTNSLVTFFLLSSHPYVISIVPFFLTPIYFCLILFIFLFLLSFKARAEPNPFCIFNTCLPSSHLH